MRPDGIVFAWPVGCGVAHVRSVRAGRRVMASTRSFLERRMRLKVNEEKRSARTSRGAFSGVPLSMPADGGGTVRARTPSVCPIVAGVVPGSRSTRTSNPLWGQQPRQSSKENDSLEFSPETSARLRCGQKERNISRCWYVAAQQRRPAGGFAVVICGNGAVGRHCRTVVRSSGNARFVVQTLVTGGGCNAIPPCYRNRRSVDHWV
jgi:hypothetical protein